MLCALWAAPAPSWSAAGSDAPRASSGEEAEGAAEALPPLPEAPVVETVELRLPPGEPEAEHWPLVAVHAGAPLSAHDVRRTIERLYGTGRFADVRVFSQPRRPGRVRVIIEARPRTFADRVSFEGNRILSAEALRAASGLRGERVEYYPEMAKRLAERIQQAYARIGYAMAAIGTELATWESGEVVLIFRIDEGLPTRIRAIHLAGDPRLSMAEVQEALGLKPGDILDHGALQAGVAALKRRLRQERCYRARVGTPQITVIEREAVVELPLNAGPRIRLAFHGNRTFDDAELRRVLDYDGEEPLDEAAVAALEQRVVTFYQLAGFADVRVRARDVRLAGGEELVVLFGVEEGERLKVTSVRIEGNRHFSAAEIRAVIDEVLMQAAPAEEEDRIQGNSLVVTGTPPAAAFARLRPDPRSVLFEPAWRQGLARVLQLYRSAGFLSAAVGPMRIERNERARTAQVIVPVSEGEQTRVLEVAFDGGPSGMPFASKVTVKPGQPLNGLQVETSRIELQRLLGRSGYLFARVLDEEQLTPDRTGAKVTFRIWPGPRVRVGRILIQGLSRTAEATVRSALSLREGGPMDPEELAQSQRNLVRLGIFRTASIRMSEPEVPEEVKDLYVTVEERSTISLTLGGGYSLIDGPRSFAEFTKLNLLGRALELQARAKVSYFNLSMPVLDDPSSAQDGWDALGRQLDLSLRYPRLLALLPSEVGVRFDLVHERLNRPNYRFQRSAAIVGTDLSALSAAPFLTASLQYEIETDQVRPITVKNIQFTQSRTDVERLRFDPGRIDMHSIRPTVGLDFRDDPASPRRGTLFLATAEVVQSLGGKVTTPDGRTETPFSLFLKASGQANIYLPLWGRTVLALSARGGRVFPLDPEKKSRTIPPKRFFLGGAGSMRGFLDEAMVPEDSRPALRQQVAECEAVLDKTGCTQAAQLARSGKALPSEGGEVFLLGRAELRFPLVWQLEGAVFLDAGNLWLDPTSVARNFRLRYASGFGLRLVTPIGPAALDLGVNLHPDPLLQEGRLVPHFSIGMF